MNKTSLVTVSAAIAVLIPHFTYAEWGVRFGGSFNTKGSFETERGLQLPGPLDPTDNPALLQDRRYDNGYNLVDSAGSPIRPGDIDPTTSYWGISGSGSQYIDTNSDGFRDSIQMSSTSYTFSQASTFDEDQDGVMPTVELYWEEAFAEIAGWTVGFSAGLRWQSVEIEGGTNLQLTTETIQDTYFLGNENLLPAAVVGLLDIGSFDGQFSSGGGFPFLNALPNPLDRTTSMGTAQVQTKREVNADLVALNFGPTFSNTLSGKLDIAFSFGGTVAGIWSDFSYDDAGIVRGSDSKDDILLGAYAGVDLLYDFSDNWYMTLGGTYTYLEDFEQSSNGRKATVEFDESYVLRIGVGMDF